jgi:DNA polymerase I-like protein with 3'-5' exonuclease and polymerase domains
MLWGVLKPVDLAAREFGGELKILVHDSICCSIPKNRTDGFSIKLRELMEREWKEIAPGFDVPAEIKVGENWAKVS